MGLLGGGALLMLLGKKNEANASELPSGSSLPIVPPSNSPSPQADSLAVQLANHLNSVIAQAGSAVKAKGRENKQLVAAFQAQEGLKADGLYGQNTRNALLKYVSNAPPVMYLPKGSSPAPSNNTSQGNESITVTPVGFPTQAGKNYLVTFSTADGKPFTQGAIDAIQGMNGTLVEASGNQAAFAVQARSDQTLSDSPVNLGGQQVFVQKVEQV